MLEGPPQEIFEERDRELERVCERRVLALASARTPGGKHRFELAPIIVYELHSSRCRGG